MKIQPTKAVPLPTNLPAAAHLTDARFPGDLAQGNVNPPDSDFGFGNAAIYGRGEKGYDIWCGSADGQDMKRAGTDFMASVAAAAKLSGQYDADSQAWGVNDRNVAVGVFQAADGAFYLQNMMWNSDGNDDGHSLMLTAGDNVRRGAAQLTAVVSSTAWADLRHAQVIP